MPYCRLTVGGLGQKVLIGDATKMKLAAPGDAAKPAVAFSSRPRPDFTGLVFVLSPWRKAKVAFAGDKENELVLCERVFRNKARDSHHV